MHTRIYHVNFSLSLYVYTYISIYLYLSLSLYIYIYIFVYINIYIYIYTHIYESRRQSGCWLARRPARPCFRMTRPSPGAPGARLSRKADQHQDLRPSSAQNIRCQNYLMLCLSVRFDESLRKVGVSLCFKYVFCFGFVLRE